MSKTHFYRRKISVTDSNQSIDLPENLLVLSIKNIGNNACYFDFDNAVDINHSPVLNPGNSWGDDNLQLPGSLSGTLDIDNIQVKCGASETTTLQLAGFVLNKIDPVS